MALDMPQFTGDALTAHREMTDQLHQWASTVHQLVKERIAALAALHPRDRGLEPIAEYVARVRLHGQEPFPEGTCLYDDLNNNTVYEHVEVEHGAIGGEGDPNRITFTGRYPLWNADSSDYKMRTVSIFVPGWLVTDPDGIGRYRARTAELVADFAADLAREEAELAAVIARVLAEHVTDGQEPESRTCRCGVPADSPEHHSFGIAGSHNFTPVPAAVSVPGQEG